jgi:hypothetical protein
MSTVKTANLNLFLDTVLYRLDNFAAIVEPFDKDFRYRRAAFTTYTNWQKGIHELVVGLCLGPKNTVVIHPLDTPTPLESATCGDQRLL